jgi:NADH-quinone oxidoreductase subunit M
VIGAFTSLDGALFYLFFEASLIPMYLIIGIWGGPRRVYAAFKFFLYTLLGSLLSLIAMVYLYSKSNSFDILVWQQLPLTAVEQSWIFIAFFLAFAVKVPMWPFHTWLPDAHVEAPTGGSMLLAALMLKLGTYGFLRFILPIAPDASHTFAPWMIALSLIAIIYIGLVALVQTDMKKLVAYSSIAHMGFVTLGIFTFQSMGMTGAVVQMISHGFISAGMFFCIGVLYDRVHSREMADYGGVAHVMPKFATFALILAMANCGLPITSGFVGELLVLMATAKISFLLAFLAGLSLILSAAYSLWMYKKVCFGKINHQHVAVLKDINAREFTVLLILVALVFFMGIYPKPFTDLINPAVSELAAHISKTKLILK